MRRIESRTASVAYGRQSKLESPGDTVASCVPGVSALLRRLASVASAGVLMLLQQGPVLAAELAISLPVVEVNSVPESNMDSFSVRGRIAGAQGDDPVADAVANGVVIAVTEPGSAGGAFPWVEIDSKSFEPEQCRFANRASLYCKDDGSGSYLRLRSIRSRPGSFRVVALARGREFGPGPIGLPLAATIEAGSGAWFSATEDCRVSRQGARTTCKREALPPLVTPTPVPTAVPSPTPTAVPSPTPTAAPSPTPTTAPSPVPTTAPSPVPTAAPSPTPTAAPSPTPTGTPSPTPVPTATPTPTPTPCIPSSVSNGKGGTYTNNCDGTVTDSTTGLMWEKKTGTTGVYRTCASAADCPSPHDVGNGYTWSQGSSGIEGLAASLFLAQLNCAGAFATGCTPFAGHSDWRLPTITELAGGTTSPSTGGIIDASQVGTAKINPIFGPTNTASPYWSSSPSAVTGTAWYAVFGNRAVASNFTATNDYLVRAVRGGGA